MATVTKRQGGISLGLGSYTLRLITAYQPKWTHVYDSSNSFQNWDFSQVNTYKGIQFSAQIQTSALPEEEYKSLIKVLQSRIFDFVSDEYTGQVEITDAPSTLISATAQGKFWTLNFTVTATSVSSGSGSL